MKRLKWVLLLTLLCVSAAYGSDRSPARHTHRNRASSGLFLRPPYLQEGDTVALVLPASKNPGNADTSRPVAMLENMGLHVKTGPYFDDRTQPYFGGSDWERATDLQAAIDDPSVKAVIAYRGGYGSVRILSAVDFEPLRRNPKWFVGFSDITMLHLQMRSMRIESIHGPMPLEFVADSLEHEGKSLAGLRSALFGELKRIDVPPHAMNRQGHARGCLAGGNLSILASAAGTPQALENDMPTVLLVEDVTEAAYRLDRMFEQLLRSGALDNVTAIVAGYFTKITDVDRYGKNAYQIMEEYASSLGIPLLCGLQAGHALPNMSVYLGREVTVDITPEGASIIFED